MSLETQGPSGKAAAKAALLYIDYLTATWMPEPLWQSWSQKGRSVASAILKIPVQGVLPTTNHLESFNGLLKRKYIPRWQRSGSRLRFNFFIHILITSILPDIFATRLSHHHYHMWLSSRFADHAGGVNLVEVRKLRAAEAPVATIGQLCWWEADARRDDEAWAIVQTHRLQPVTQTVSIDQYETTCFSASAPLHSLSSTQYKLYLHRMGHGHCSCSDFAYRGGACKHLRALRIVVESWVKQHFILPFHYPSSISAAKHLHPTQPTQINCTHSETIAPTRHRDRHGDASHTGPLTINNIFALQRLAGDTDMISEGLADTEVLQDAPSVSDSTSESNDLEDNDPVFAVRAC